MTATASVRSTVIVVDIGGTSIRAASVGPQGAIVGEVSTELHSTRGDETMRLVNDQISHLADPSTDLAIVLGVPGTVTEDGLVTEAPALEWHDYKPADHLANQTLPVFIENDVNLAALGEWSTGAAAGHCNVVVLMIGTGLGAGIIVSDRLVRGAHGAAGEAGFLVPSVEALDHEFDGFGPMEAVVSALGLNRLAGSHITGGRPSMSIPDIASAARNGIDWAVDVFRTFADHLAIAVANVAALLDPGVVVLGGGIVAAQDLFLDRAIARAQNVFPDLPPVVISQLGPRAPLLGGRELFEGLYNSAKHKQSKGQDDD